MEKALITILNPATGFYTCVKVDAIHANGIVDNHTKAGKLTSVIVYTSDVDNTFKSYK